MAFDDQEYIAIIELCDEIKFPYKTALKACKKRELHAVRFFSKWFSTQEDWDRYIENFHFEGVA